MQQATYALMLLACGFASWRGGRTERVAAAAIFVGWTITPALTLHDWSAPQYALLAIDGFYFAIMLVLGLTSARYWPMPAAAFALLPVLMQVAFIINPRIWPWTFFVAGRACDFLVLVILAGGTWLEVDRGRRHKNTLGEGTPMEEPG